jgi:aldehyde:ferredoxin oxidoreductase
MLRQRFPEGRAAVLTIGPAGENRVPMACIVSDRDHAAGRTGLGAVMGAKNLKAVVVCGVQAKRPKRTEVQKRAVAAYVRRIRQSREYAFFSRHGGAGYTVWCSDERFAPGYHYRSPGFAAADRIDGRRLEADRVRSRGCPRCPVRCKAELRQAGKPRAFRPEFESMVNLGAKCGLSDLDSLVRLDNLCTRLGLDVISAATAIAFAMELSEKGLLPQKMDGGAVVGWGDPAAMERLIRQMAAARGFGRLLGAGVRRAAAQIGPEARQLACHVKGLELSAYHPGYLLGAALGYAVSSRGGDFNNIYAAMEYSWSPARGERMFGTPASVDRRSIQGKGALIRHASILTCALDALGLCKVPALSLIGDFDLESEADLVRALTGMALDAADLLEAGERIVNIERLFNLEHGLDPDRDDRLPQRFYTAGCADEGPFLTPDGFSAMLQDYYAAMGWDRLGHPRVETLCRLQLSLPSQGADDSLPSAAAGAGGEPGAATVPKTGQGRASSPRPAFSGSGIAETGVNKNQTRR